MNQHRFDGKNREKYMNCKKTEYMSINKSKIYESETSKSSEYGNLNICEMIYQKIENVTLQSEDMLG